MIAALPMYDHPRLRGATDALWAAIRDAALAEGLPAPDRLTRSPDLWSLWERPDLVLAQTCGLPYRARLHRTVTLVATPDYGLPDTPRGHYRSHVVARQGDRRRGIAAFAGARLAYNDPLSQSGWAAAAALGPGLRPTLETGSHAASARAVAEGRADLAAIDAVSWRLMERFDGVTDRLRIVETTPAVPGLPLITAQADRAEAIARAAEAGIATLDSDMRRALGLTGLARIPREAYLRLEIPPTPAEVAAESG